MGIVFSVAMLALMVAALIDIILRDESQVKHLPKVVWILLVIFIPLVGIALWFIIGREYTGVSVPRPRARTATAADEQVPSRRYDARTTEEQLADLDREIEYYRKLAELEQRKREAEGGEPAS